MTTFKNLPKIFPVEATEKIKTHIGTDYFALIELKKERITLEPMSKYIHCKTAGKILVYRDLFNMDEPVWTNSMCNKLGRLSRGWKKHAGTDTIEFIFHI